MAHAGLWGPRTPQAAGVVQETLRLDPFSGAVFVFRAKRADRVKLLVWDGSGSSGVWGPRGPTSALIYKRLEDGKFCWPRVEDGVMRLSSAQLGALFAGVGLRGPHTPQQGSNGNGCTRVEWQGQAWRSKIFNPCDRVNHPSRQQVTARNGHALLPA